jgi:hypothetical protein
MDTTLPLRSPFAQLDPRFLLILFASIATHMLIATWVARQPAAPVETELDQPLDRFAPLHPIPKFAPVPAPRVAHVAPAPLAPHGPTGPGRAAPSLLGLMQGGFGELTKGDARTAIDGAQLGNVDTSLLAQQRRDGTSQLQQIAPLTTDGVKQVGFGERTGPGPAARLPDIDTQDFKDLPDPQAIAHFVNAHRRALAYCYEAELKRRSGLRGRITLRFDIGELGRPADITIVDDTLGSLALETCLISAVRRWVLPVRADFPVQFPILFTPAE